jgi:hypothetical protein
MHLFGRAKRYSFIAVSAYDIVFLSSQSSSQTMKFCIFHAEWLSHAFWFPCEAVVLVAFGITLTSGSWKARDYVSCDERLMADFGLVPGFVAVVGAFNHFGNQDGTDFHFYTGLEEVISWWNKHGVYENWYLQSVLSE